MLGKSINNMPEFLQNKKDSIASTSFYDIAGNVIRSMPVTVKAAPVTKNEPQRQMEDLKLQKPETTAAIEETQARREDSDTPTPT